MSEAWVDCIDVEQAISLLEQSGISISDENSNKTRYLMSKSEGKIDWDEVGEMPTLNVHGFGWQNNDINRYSLMIACSCPAESVDRIRDNCEIFGLFFSPSKGSRYLSEKTESRTKL
jgi:hypothetical protein